MGQAAARSAPDFIEEVQIQIAGMLREDGSVLGEAGRRLCCAAGAKRLRPRLVEIFGHALHVPRDALLDLATTAELIHAASLLHDDVIDAADERRGVPTANASWGNLVAVLAGDLVLSTSLLRLERHPVPVRREALETVQAMTRAAALEAEARGRADLDLARWREIAEGKTGMLFRWCGRGPALLAGDAAAAACFGDYGLQLGVAFQIADDLADLVADGTGKPRFADLRTRNVSLPILLGAREDPELAREVAALWANGRPPEPDISRVGGLLLSTAAPADCAERLSRELDDALSALGPYACLPELATLLHHTEQLRQRSQIGENT